MIQDTSFVIDVLAGDRDALDVLEVVERERKPQKVAAVTVLKLYEGVERSDRPDDEKEAVLDVLDSKTVVDADREITRRAGRISGRLFTAGTPIDREDCLVAATALQEDEPVLTRNADHFDRVADLDVRTY